MRHLCGILLLATLAACDSSKDATDQSMQLVQFVESNKTGTDTDHWIEVRNYTGEWEKTVLVFGYIGDFDECQKAMAGLKKVNYAREYRCVPANQK